LKKIVTPHKKPRKRKDFKNLPKIELDVVYKIEFIRTKEELIYDPKYNPIPWIIDIHESYSWCLFEHKWYRLIISYKRPIAKKEDVYNITFNEVRNYRGYIRYLYKGYLSLEEKDEWLWTVLDTTIKDIQEK